ncbi:MAG: M14 family zinc carboxypeptidase [Bryobacteraceae bacterium]
MPTGGTDLSLWLGALLLLAAAVAAFAFQTAPTGRVADAFALGWLLEDTNGDGIADILNGRIVVPASPSAAQNTAAANLAARAAYGTTGLTPPVVIAADEDSGGGPRIWVGKEAVPSSTAAGLAAFSLAADEGGVFAIAGNLALIGSSDAGLLAAADAYSARAPYLWRPSGEKLAAITEVLREVAPGASVELAGVCYLHGKTGVHRAFLRAIGITADTLKRALASPRLAAVHGLAVLGGESAESTGPEPAAPAPNASAGQDAAAAEAGPGAEAGGAAAGPTRLDLATLYTSRGLFGAAGRIPLPASSNARLYVPGGREGIAMANLAARMGLETTGITLPIAAPADSSMPREVRAHAILAGNSPLAREAERKMRTQDTAAGESETPLAPSEGEVRVVDDAFGRRSAVLALGDGRGQTAAIGVLADRFPNLWEQGKQFLSIEEIRYDLHRFFSLHSSSGQAAAALYHLDRWMKAAGSAAGIRDVKAEVYADLADPRLAEFIRRRIDRQWHLAADVKTASLRAGTACCAKDPSLHFESPGYPFHQATPTFTEDIPIPWEGRRLLDTVRGAAARISAGQEVTLAARLSEGPGQRRKLEAQLRDILAKAGADPRKLSVEVLCAYKQGYSWLMDEIAPALSAKPVAAVKIDFAKDVDPTNMRAMHTDARWVQELYPVDEMLARKLNLPLDRISLNRIEPPADGATYRVHAFDAAGKEVLARSFRVATVVEPYNGVLPRYEDVQVETGWVRLDAAGKSLLNQRVKTDIEEFWEHYQNQTLPRIYRLIMSQARGEIRAEYLPPFDTLTLDIHMSEPDYNLDLDKERISTLEALQEDTFYSTANFISMVGDLETGRPIAYTGRIIPIVHSSEDGKDGRVHIEFYAKPAANPLVRLAWTDAKGERHVEERNLPPMTGEFQPRLIQARVKDGAEGIERLTFLMPADFLEDRYDNWLKLEGQDQVDRTIFPAERARGMLDWLARMHAAGIYPDELAYPRLHRIAVEFELPREARAAFDSPAPRVFASFPVVPPATPRPMIGDFQAASSNPIVQWNEPISPGENTAILARLARYPGVNVYSMGRSYLGRNIWAADITLPSPALLRSWPKETTLKASIVYSGRQHANEVSSTSHIDKLAEQLVTDAGRRELLKKVNVVLHPIDNPDGAQLSVDLAAITPDNLLHAGYHGALSADVSSEATAADPMYPESRTRKQLIDGWLPDAFLNPHGYPSHEWVQPFSEYTGWVQNRQGANTGRAWWIPRGWFTSMGYLRDEQHPYSKTVAFAIQDRIVEAERAVPGLLALEDRMNSRYQRFGQRWQPKDMFQPIVDGIRIYMSLKGAAGGGRGGAPGGEAGAAAAAATSGSGGVMGLSPDVTWDAAYTEAPDETAHGDYMKLMAAAGLAFDYVHLNYLAQGDLRVTRTGRETNGAVQWRLDRPRPILPAGVKPVPTAGEGQ